MKKNFKYAMMMATALVLGFSSCSSDDNDPIEGGGSHVVEGKVTKAEIRISAPATYSNTGTTAGALAEESEVTNVAILIYKGSGYLEKAEVITSGITLDPTKKFYKVGSIEATTGQKQVFVLVNAPTQYGKDKFETDFKTVDKLETLKQELTVANLTTDEGFTMSSVVAPKEFKLLKEDGSTPNKINLEVSRLTAKFSVMSDISLNPDLTDGTISNLQFAVGQINKYTYLAQNKNLSGVVEDPNYNTDGKDATQHTGVPTPTDYIGINSYKSNVDDIYKFDNVKYALENTNAIPYKGAVTYVAIQGKFVPKVVMYKENDKWEEGDATKLDNTGDFYKLKTSKGNRIFASQNAALEFAKDKLNKDFEGKPQEEKDKWVKDNIDFYEGGLTYYTVYPEQENGVNILRNSYHNITIKSIKGLGDKKPGPQEKPDGETPDEETPVGVETSIEVEITPLPWNFYTEEVDLEPQS